ncbi:putative glycolipid-binding domain-containing protein [Pyxidicoccus fallax]|uniref:Putative glycolipid-binding domain-containing protein n=1 Tax=Pyxidicoccus fallax TaxID=394095 RepID=A0A848LRB4_9BACT|nr:putative glycolipid-binding domain-containing protein [Pyxidicoccus fallax]NMO20447.1 putative glycolipid-binding domain-containing protein [Pyxidicoccus fallax]NPC85281.1 putative glycolipid-binding domain-containing protein [Pyxidicoccus fallax]
MTSVRNDTASGGAPDARCLRALVWRRMDPPGTEYFELRESADGWELAGSVVLADEGVPCAADYTIHCDARWATREARIRLRREGVEQSLSLRVDAQRRWWRGDEEVPQFRGCTDIDLAFTPSTNTLPIRRLALDVGKGSDVTAAWVRMPDLSLVTLPQRYTRLTQSRYRYESNGGSFVAEVETDELGLVLTYPPGWERVASTGR